MQTDNEIVMEARADGAPGIVIDRANKRNALSRHMSSGIARAVDDAARTRQVAPNRAQGCKRSILRGG